jgi:single-strand DNA-binding protein
MAIFYSIILVSMNSLNKVQLIGNLTADPEVKQTPNGQFVANLSLATNRQWRDSAGMEQKQTEFHNIVVWGKLAEICQTYLKKGQKAYLEGRLQTRSWDDPSGQKRYKTEVVAENLIMLSPRGDLDFNGGEMPTEDAPSSTPVKSKKSTPKPEEEISIEDIPF